MGIWQALEYLNTLVDDSDPDTRLSQIAHCLQTAEGIRADGHPDWFILAGLVHDLGKILCLFGEPQWAVTGDTFPLGCQFRDSIVYPEYFAANSDSAVPGYNSPLGIYQAHCGLDNVTLSWGHDEYMYLVAKDYLPQPALYMIRYHSFYPGHSTRSYDDLFSEHDREMFPWVREFNRYDLYTKHDQPPDVAALRPYYEDLISRYFPDQVDF
jgi:inositol oxygenase